MIVIAWQWNPNAKPQPYDHTTIRDHLSWMPIYFQQHQMGYFSFLFLIHHQAILALLYFFFFFSLLVISSLKRLKVTFTTEEKKLFLSPLDK